MNTTRTCPVCDGDGVERIGPRGRPRRDGVRRSRWVWCRRCDARGWVYTRPGRQAVPRPPRTRTYGGVPLDELKAARQTRGREFYARWRDGESQPAIAATLDPAITRERVRQLIYEATPAWEIALTHELHAARARLRDYVRAGHVPVVRECWICGTATTTSTTAAQQPTCERHRDRDNSFISSSLRLICNLNGRRDSWRNAPSVVAHRPLGATAANAGHRWTNTGSYADRVIVEAVENGWPLVELLPDEVVDRIRDRLAERSRP